MKKGYYKHKRAMDTFIEVVSTMYVGPHYTKVKIYWWVKTKHGEPYKPFYSTSSVKILTKHLADWDNYSLTPIVNPIVNINQN